MPNAQGTGASVVLGFESTFNVLPGTPPGEKVPVVNPSLNPSRNTFRSNSLTGVPEPRPVVFGKVGDDGDLGIECNPASFSTANKGLFGTPRVGGVTLFNLEYTFGAQPSMYLEERHTDVNQYFLHNGLLLGGTQWTFGAEGLMEARYRVMASGKVAINGSSQISGAVTDRTGYDPFSYLLCRIKQGGSVIGYSQAVEVNIDRKLGSAIAQDQATYRAAIFSEIPELTGKMTALFQDAVLANLSLSGAETSLEIWCPGLTGYAILCELPTIKFRPYKKNINGTGLVTLDLEFDGYGKAGVSQVAGRTWGGYLSASAFPALNTLTLVLLIDGGGNQTITFTASENTLDLVVTKINATLTGALASADRAAGDVGGVLRIQSSTKGTGSSVRVQSASTAAVLLGLDTNVTHTGLDGKSIVTTVFSSLNS
jgi:hypothetical protein